MKIPWKKFFKRCISKIIYQFLGLQVNICRWFVNTLKQQQHEVDKDDEDCDEKKFKEEIVLIGEKCDIEFLLDNQNKQLFNLILTNSHRSKQLSSMESDLYRERYNRLKRQDGKTKLASDDDIQIEIDSSIIHGLINIWLWKTIEIIW